MEVLDWEVYTPFTHPVLVPEYLTLGAVHVRPLIVISCLDVESGVGICLIMERAFTFVFHEKGLL